MEQRIANEKKLPGRIWQWLVQSSLKYIIKLRRKRCRSLNFYKIENTYFKINTFQ